jgi:hypothetical protein
VGGQQCQWPQIAQSQTHIRYLLRCLRITQGNSCLTIVMRSSSKFYINQLLNELLLVMTQLPQSSKPWQESPENTGKYLWRLSVELRNLTSKNHGSDVDKGSHPRLLTSTHGTVTYSRIPPTCSQWSSPKITSPIWPYQAKNSLCLTCGRSRTNISTLNSNKSWRSWPPV